MKYERHIMRVDLSARTINWKPWSPEYAWMSWNDSLLEPMAKLVYLAFSSTADAAIFPRFRTQKSCKMSVTRMITQKGFFASASGINAISVSSGVVYAGGIIGAILEDKTGWIQNVFVDPGMHGRGIGSFLVEHLLKAFIKNGNKQVGLHVTATNAPAIGLYSNYGFEITETIEMEPKDF